MFAHYHTDPYARSFKSTVVSLEPVKAEPKSAKAKKDAASASAVANYRLRLADTILYPTGGGQPFDTGFINSIPVINVETDPSDHAIYHYINLAPDFALDSLSPSSPVSIELNWTRRFDHMQQHSGQHLISAVVYRLTGLKTVSWWLSTWPQTSFIELSGKELKALEGTLNNEEEKSLSMQQNDANAFLQLFQSRCNDLIRGNLPFISHVFESRDSAQSALSKFSFSPIKSIPADLEGAIRLVEIPGVDLNFCGGTHTKSTGELQSLFVSHLEKGKDSIKIHFLVGQRALEVMKSSLDIQRQITQTLTVQPEFHVDMVKRLQDENRVQGKTVAKLNAKLAKSIGDAMIQRVNREMQEAKQSEAGKKTLLLEWWEEEENPGFFTELTKYIEFAPEMAPICKAKTLEEAPIALLFVTVCGGVSMVPAAQGAAGQPVEGNYSLVSFPPQAEIVQKMGAELNTLFSGRGGGKNGRFQGKGKTVKEDTKDAAIKKLKEMLGQ